MDDGSRELLEDRIASYPYWHYQLDLGEVSTSPKRALGEYHRQRAQRIVPALEHAVGGSLAGARVLDLGCNAGFWLLEMVDAGCAEVVGVEAEPTFVEQARLVLDAREVPPPHRVVVADAFDVTADVFGTFDVVLCLGLLYHVTRPIELMALMTSLSRALLVVDTQVTSVGGPYFELYRNGPPPEGRRGHQAGSIEPFPFSLRPSPEALITLANRFGFPTVDRLGTYLDGRRESLLFSRAVG